MYVCMPYSYVCRWNIILEKIFSIFYATKPAASDALNEHTIIIKMVKKKVRIAQCKNIERAILDAMLKEVTLEVQKWKGKKVTKRGSTYGVMNAIIKKHLIANPWLNRTRLNNYKWSLDHNKTIRIDQTSQSLSSLTTDFTALEMDADDAEPPIDADDAEPPIDADDSEPPIDANDSPVEQIIEISTEVEDQRALQMRAFWELIVQKN